MNVVIEDEDVPALMDAIKRRLQEIADSYQHSYEEDSEIASLTRTAKSCGYNAGITPASGGRSVAEVYKA